MTHPIRTYLVGGRVDQVYSEVPVGLDVGWVKHSQNNPAIKIMME